MSCKQVNYKLISRKPARWAVAADAEVGVVTHNPSASRAQRWQLDTGDTVKGFKSRRAAFHFFRTGERFTTNPVYQVLGGRRGTKRIR